jgi:hypothetical protein
VNPVPGDLAFVLDREAASELPEEMIREMS